jgi:hypothetical protein
VPTGRATAKVIAEELDANLGSVKARLSVLKGHGEVVEAGRNGHEVEWGLASRQGES